jgi:outer membrane protein OmpA-like peptidoglycan-associated protein
MRGKPVNKGLAWLFRILAVGACLPLSACILIHASAISQSSGSGSPVSTEHSDYGILHLTAPADLTSASNADLVKQCQSGLLSDVQTQLSMREWFLVQYYTLAATAVCQPPPPPPAPPPGPVAQKLVLRGVHFAFNRADIRPEDEPVLDEAADTIKANPNAKIQVNGYCDSIGSAAYNLKLSQRRAEAVANYLTNKGVSASQLTAQGFGKTNFVATNRTREGRAQNRRVELVPTE